MASFWTRYLFSNMASFWVSMLVFWGSYPSIPMIYQLLPGVAGQWFRCIAGLGHGADRKVTVFHERDPLTVASACNILSLATPTYKLG